MYCEYWNLKKPPFDNVPDPSMYVDSNISMENVISETIFSIKEGNECFAVIIGDIGLGKTLSLRIIIDSLEPEKYKIALITNPGITFIQLLREIIGQITGKFCEEKNKADLLEIFNRLLFETTDKGQKIVIFIDEANALSPANLENLRLLTNMQDDQRNFFTIVLAGQMELAQRLEHPKHANLLQRVGTYGRIDKFPSEQAVKSYIETRLKLAGTQKEIFTSDAISGIWEYSEHGVPRLINKICKLCLKAGEINNYQVISNEIVTQVTERFLKLSKTALQKRKPRRRPEPEISNEDITFLSDNSLAKNAVRKGQTDDISRSDTIRLKPPQMPTEGHDKNIDPENNIKYSNQDLYNEINVSGQKIIITIPRHILEKAKKAELEEKNKLAGHWAASLVKNNDQLTLARHIDPVLLWQEIRDNIFNMMINRISTGK
jgi:type II secretory pathway predicted ATPase ExeA